MEPSLIQFLKDHKRDDRDETHEVHLMAFLAMDRAERLFIKYTKKLSNKNKLSELTIDDEINACRKIFNNYMADDPKQTKDFENLFSFPITSTDLGLEDAICILENKIELKSLFPNTVVYQYNMCISIYIQSLKSLNEMREDASLKKLVEVVSEKINATLSEVADPSKEELKLYVEQQKIEHDEIHNSGKNVARVLRKELFFGKFAHVGWGFCLALLVVIYFIVQGMSGGVSTARRDSDSERPFKKVWGVSKEEYNELYYKRLQ